MVSQTFCRKLFQITQVKFNSFYPFYSVHFFKKNPSLSYYFLSSDFVQDTFFLVKMTNVIVVTRLSLCVLFFSAMYILPQIFARCFLAKARFHKILAKTGYFLVLMVNFPRNIHFTLNFGFSIFLGDLQNFYGWRSIPPPAAKYIQTHVFECFSPKWRRNNFLAINPGQWKAALFVAEGNNPSR